MTRTLLFVLVAVGVLAFVVGRRSADDPARVAQLTRTVDSLTRTQAAFTAQQARVDTVVRVAQQTAATASQRAAHFRSLADSLGRLAHIAAPLSQDTIPTEAPTGPVTASDSVRAIPLLRGQVVALTAALDALTGAYRADSVALDTLTAAHRAALARLAVATAAADTGRVLARQGATWRFGFLTLPRVPKVVAALVGCAAGGYLDRADPVRGCGLVGLGLTVLAPTR